MQGDFTLSNIVVNHDNDAKIIDINRRGCPVGWEPPEIATKIASSQRISMYIGQKSDLYQLGMTLWGLAMDEDEPERHDQSFSMTGASDEVPDWFKEIVHICLSPQPRDRLSAKELLCKFPLLPLNHAPNGVGTTTEVLDERSPKRYIEPHAAVEREDLERLGRSRRRSTSEGPSTEDASLVDPPSSYHFDSGSSFVGIQRGRRPPAHAEQVDEHEARNRSFEEHQTDSPWDENEVAPLIISISPGREPRYEGCDYASNLNQHPEASEHQVEEQPPQSDAYMTPNDPLGSSDATPEVRHEQEPQASDIDLDLPNPHSPVADATKTSVTSDSTPRNATSAMTTSMALIPPPRSPDLITADLAGFGGHPILEEYSPHEPMKLQDSQISRYYDSHAQQQDSIDPAQPPVPLTESDLPSMLDPPGGTAVTGNPEPADLVGSEPATSLTPPHITTVSEENHRLPAAPESVPTRSPTPPATTTIISEENQHLPAAPVSVPYTSPILPVTTTTATTITNPVASEENQYLPAAPS